MKTPAGSECSYFFGDYYRGRENEECRLLGSAWKASLCKTCPVPSIELANACKFMRLKGEVTRPIMAGFKSRVKISTYCEKNQSAGFDAHIGCGECHPFPTIFEVKK